MKKYCFLILALYFSICFSQFDYNFSYEAKYGNGKQVDEQSEESEAIKYGYNEHLIDMNVYCYNLFPVPLQIIRLHLLHEYIPLTLRHYLF